MRRAWATAALRAAVAPLSLTLAAGAMPAQDRAAPVLVLTGGVRTDGGRAISALWEVVGSAMAADSRAAVDADAKVRTWLFDHGTGALPATASMWIDPALFAAGFARGNVFSGIVVFETATPIDVAAFAAEVGGRPLEGIEGAWHAAGRYVRRLPAASGGRVLMTVDDPSGRPWSGGENLPAPSRPLARCIERVRDAALWLCFDVGALLALAAKPEAGDTVSAVAMAAQRLPAFVGPRGALLSFAVRDAVDHVTFDMVSSMTPGSGIVGLALPKDAGDAVPLGTPPFDPEIVFAVDLGPSAAKSFQLVSQALREGGAGAIDPGILDSVGEVADAWSGRLTSWMRAGDAPELVAVVEVAPDAVDSMLDVVRARLPALAEGEGGVWRGRTRTRTGEVEVAFAARGARIVFAAGGEAAANVAATAADRDPVDAFAELRRDRASVKTLMRSAFVAREADNPELARAMLGADGCLTVQLGWDAEGTRLRFGIWRH